MKTFLWLTTLLTTLSAWGAKLGEPVTFTGTCDASAAWGLAGDLFVVANDEDNLLRFYRFSCPGPSLQTYDLNPLFANLRKTPESDLEGAARLGNQFFLITSHGRNASGKFAPARHRFFALNLTETNGAFALQPAGQIYTNLVTDLARHPDYARFDLNAAANLAPKSPGGLNIEALTATPEGSLLIGFRNPIPEQRALVAVLHNPNQVIRGAPPEFGPPFWLELGGLGLRGMSATTNGYFLLAGPAEGGGKSRLYFWGGGKSVPRLLNEIRFNKSNPEGICCLDFGAHTDFLIVSDDGTRKIGGTECKSLPEAQRQFRAYRFTP